MAAPPAGGSAMHGGAGRDAMEGPAKHKNRHCDCSGTVCLEQCHCPLPLYFASVVHQHPWPMDLSIVSVLNNNRRCTLITGGSDRAVIN
jgi:hypothetical protein